MATKDPLLWSDTNMAHSFMLHLETLGVTTAIILAAKHLSVGGRTANDLPVGTMARKPLLSFRHRGTGVFLCTLISAGVPLCGAF